MFLYFSFVLHKKQNIIFYSLIVIHLKYFHVAKNSNYEIMWEPRLMRIPKILNCGKNHSFLYVSRKLRHFLPYGFGEEGSLLSRQLVFNVRVKFSYSFITYEGAKLVDRNGHARRWKSLADKSWRRPSVSPCASSRWIRGCALTIWRP